MPAKMGQVTIGERHGARTACGQATTRRFPCGDVRMMAEVVCDCGAPDAVDVSAWRRGKCNECSSCRARRMLSARKGLHGGSRSSEYQSWLAMRRRCLDPSFNKFKDYGAIGITIYAPWAHSFQEFIADVGSKPSRTHTLDRVDNYGGYYPYNVRWATPKEQRANQRPVNENWENWENATTGY